MKFDIAIAVAIGMVATAAVADVRPMSLLGEQSAQDELLGPQATAKIICETEAYKTVSHDDPGKIYEVMTPNGKMYLDRKAFMKNYVEKCFPEALDYIEELRRQKGRVASTAPA